MDIFVADIASRIEEENYVIIPEYVAEAACKIGRQRAGFSVNGRSKPDCELSIINEVCFRHNLTPTQFIYDEVYAELSNFGSI